MFQINSHGSPLWVVGILGVKGTSCGDWNVDRNRQRERQAGRQTERQVKHINNDGETEAKTEEDSSEKKTDGYCTVFPTIVDINSFILY